MLNDPETSHTLTSWSELLMHRSMSEFKKILDDNGLSPSQMITLFRLYHGVPFNISSISTGIGVSKAACSQLADRLVTLNLVDRVEDLTDRRVKYLRLTAKGKDLVEQVVLARRQWMEELIAELNPEQVAVVVSALTMLTYQATKTQEK